MSDDINSLIADLGRAGLRAGAKAAKVVEASSRNVRDTARELAPRTRLPHYRNSITAEVKLGARSVEAEIGPEKGGQGSLGHILEKGSAVSPPHAHLGPALDQEGPDFMKALEEIANPFG